MKVFQAVIMGIVQGLMEFLPVSSSGHLALIKGLFGIETDTGVLFDVLLHVATLVAICAVFFKDILRLVSEFIGMVKDIFGNAVAFGKSLSGSKAEYVKIISNPYRKFVLFIIVSNIPTAIIGFCMQDVVKFATTNLLICGICLICSGLILLLSDFIVQGEKRLKEMNYGDAFCVGISQGIATLPGLSRSGSTIAAGLLCGLDKKFAAKYSFIMSIPAVFGALILELTDIGNMTVTGGDVGCYILGMIIATVVGFFVLKITMKLVINNMFKYIGVYTATIGIVSIIVYFVKK